MVIFFHHKNTFSMLLWWIILMLIDLIYFNIISLQWYYNFLLVVLFLKIYANYPNHKKTMWRLFEFFGTFLLIYHCKATNSAQTNCKQFVNQTCKMPCIFRELLPSYARLFYEDHHWSATPIVTPSLNSSHDFSPSKEWLYTVKPCRASFLYPERSFFR